MWISFKEKSLCIMYVKFTLKNLVSAMFWRFSILSNINGHYFFLQSVFFYILYSVKLFFVRKNHKNSHKVIFVRFSIFANMSSLNSIMTNCFNIFFLLILCSSKQIHPTIFIFFIIFFYGRKKVFIFESLTIETLKICSINVVFIVQLLN